MDTITKASFVREMADLFTFTIPTALRAVDGAVRELELGLNLSRFNGFQAEELERIIAQNNAHPAPRKNGK